MNAVEVRRALACGRQGCACHRGTNTHCPVHEDGEPSLTVHDGRGGTLLFHCKTGCSQADVMRELKARGLFGGEKQPTPIRQGAERLVKEYEFRDASGLLLALHGRFEDGNGKTFRWRTPHGEWKDGLGFPESNLPLYNLAAVLQDPEARVWFVEGEKAADACTAQGLVAVSLPGGASQQRFGNALDPLLERDVVLWPDNDDAGRALMQRVAGYLPNARTVNPALAPKSDAYDYFANGGTLAGLEELLHSNAPSVRIVDADTVLAEFPVSGGLLSFTFTNWSISGNVARASLAVESSLPGQRALPYRTDLNMGSASTREGVRREIEQFFGQSGKESPWTRAVSWACSAADAAWKSIDASVDLRDVAVPAERHYQVDRFLPERVGSIIFGMGGSGKSFLGASVLLHALHGEPWLGRDVRQVPAALVIDYEDSEAEWRLRVNQLALGAGLPIDERIFRYMPGRGIPIHEQRTQIIKLIQEYGIGFVLIDSAASASGGDLLDVSAAAKLTSALAEFGRFGATSLLIAHNTKAQDSQYPYGNIMWHNLVRATHYIEASQAEGSLTLDVVIHNRKANRGRQLPISARVTFPATDSGPVKVELLDFHANEAARSETAQVDVIEAELRTAGGRLSVKQLEARTRIPSNQVRSLLARMGTKVVQVGRAGNPDGSNIWALTTQQFDVAQHAQHASGDEEPRATVAPNLSGDSTGVREEAPRYAQQSAQQGATVLRGAAQQAPLSKGAYVAPVAPMPFEDEEERIDSLAAGDA